MKERKIWTDENKHEFKEKNWGFGQTEDNKKKTNKKKLSPDLSELLTRFTTSMGMNFIANCSL